MSTREARHPLGLARPHMAQKDWFILLHSEIINPESGAYLATSAVWE